MIKLPKTSLPQDTLAGLKRYQEAVDGAGSYPKRVQQACRLFPARNVRSNPVFRSVRETLNRMAHGARRCGYCEDSYADEVEHVRPKSLYPECVFRWSNYLYVCGACNTPKNNQFAVFLPRARKPTVVSRSARAPVKPTRCRLRRLYQSPQYQPYGPADPRSVGDLPVSSACAKRDKGSRLCIVHHRGVKVELARRIGEGEAQCLRDLQGSPSGVHLREESWRWRR